MPQRKHYLWVCTNERAANHPLGSCAQRGGTALLLALKKRIAEEGFAKTLRACGSTCIDICWEGAVVGVMPDNIFYGGVTLDDVDDIVDGLKNNRPVERLVIKPDRFDKPSDTPAGLNSEPNKPNN